MFDFTEMDVELHKAEEILKVALEVRDAILKRRTAQEKFEIYDNGFKLGYNAGWREAKRALEDAHEREE